MPKICYVPKKFGEAAQDKIAVCNAIISEYARQGFDLTLRQLYYQCVARGYIANNLNEYKKLGELINDARLAGLIDWSHIVDRVRNLRKQAAWDNPADIINSARASYHMDHWENQDTYAEVWVEKNALIGVIEPVCDRWDTPYFACIGYTSASEMWEAAQRVGRKIAKGKQVTIIHLGDHDPSGKDMTRDIEERFRLFLSQDMMGRYKRRLKSMDFEVRRIALNWNQIEQYNPPPNPTKLTDSRALSYIEQYGTECWELDALSPTVIDSLIENEITALIDLKRWNDLQAEEDDGKELLQKTVNRWEDLEVILKAWEG